MDDIADYETEGLCANSHHGGHRTAKPKVDSVCGCASSSVSISQVGRKNTGWSSG